MPMSSPPTLSPRSPCEWLGGPRPSLAAVKFGLGKLVEPCPFFATRVVGGMPVCNTHHGPAVRVLKRLQRVKAQMEAALGFKLDVL